MKHQKNESQNNQYDQQPNNEQDQCGERTKQQTQQHQAQQNFNQSINQNQKIQQNENHDGEEPKVDENTNLYDKRETQIEKLQTQQQQIIQCPPQNTNSNKKIEEKNKQFKKRTQIRQPPKNKGNNIQEQVEPEQLDPKIQQQTNTQSNQNSLNQDEPGSDQNSQKQNNESLKDCIVPIEQKQSEEKLQQLKNSDSKSQQQSNAQNDQIPLNKEPGQQENEFGSLQKIILIPFEGLEEEYQLQIFQEQQQQNENNHQIQNNSPILEHTEFTEYRRLKPSIEKYEYIRKEQKLNECFTDKKQYMRLAKNVTVINVPIVANEPVVINHSIIINEHAVINELIVANEPAVINEQAVINETVLINEKIVNNKPAAIKETAEMKEPVATNESVVMNDQEIMNESVVKNELAITTELNAKPIIQEIEQTKFIVVERIIDEFIEKKLILNESQNVLEQFTERLKVDNCPTHVISQTYQVIMCLLLITQSQNDLFAQQGRQFENLMEQLDGSIFQAVKKYYDEMMQQNLKEKILRLAKQLSIPHEDIEK